MAEVDRHLGDVLVEQHGAERSLDTGEARQVCGQVTPRSREKRFKSDRSLDSCWKKVMDRLPPLESREQQSRLQKNL